MILIILLVFGLAISLAYKIEFHFRYYRKTNSQEENYAGSVVDSINRFEFVNPLILLPIFFGRKKELESQNIELFMLASRIKRTCYIFYTLSIFLLTIIFI